MTINEAFVSFTIDTAPEASRAMLEGAKKAFGTIPSLLTKLAASPQFLRAFEGGNAVWAETALSPLEREVVVMVVATENGCDYCVAMHTRILGALKAEPEVIAALRDSRPLADPKLEALATFTRALLATRGKTDGAQFFAAGYEPRHALDVMVGIGTYTMSTYANRLIGAELDPALERYRWSPKGAE